MSILEDFVDEIVSENLAQFSEISDELNVSDLDGLEYEAYCEAILEAHGWDIIRTPATGDHGVDLIAENSGRRVAIQCKKYNSPVGNKAVQEAYSGMKFFEASEAVVVSNAPFTSAAKQLAYKLSVALVHESQLVEL